MLKRGVRWAAALAASSLLSAPAGVLLAASPPTCETLLVVEKGEGALAAYNLAGGRLLWRSPAGADPHEIAVSPDGTRAFVSNYGGPGSDLHTISPFELATGKPLPPIDIAPFRSPHGMLVREGALFFTAESSKIIARYDIVSGRVVWAMGTGQNRSHMLVAGPGETLITANASSGSVSLIERVQVPFGSGPPRNDWQVTNLPTGEGTQGIDVSPDGAFLWAMAAKEGVVSIVALADKQVVARVSVPWKSGNRLKITPDGRFALIGSEQLVAVDTATKQVRIVEIGHSRSEGILIAPDGKRAFVDLPQEDRIAIVRLPELRVDGYLMTGKQPDGLACAGKIVR